MQQGLAHNMCSIKHCRRKTFWDILPGHLNWTRQELFHFLFFSRRWKLKPGETENTSQGLIAFQGVSSVSLSTQKENQQEFYYGNSRESSLKAWVHCRKKIRKCTGVNFLLSAREQEMPLFWYVSKLNWTLKCQLPGWREIRNQSLVACPPPVHWLI